MRFTWQQSMTSLQRQIAAPPFTTALIASDLDDLLRRGLDWVERVAPYDLAAILMLDGAHLTVRCARGRLASEAVRGHRLALSNFPTVREAIETRRARSFSEDDHVHGDGDPFDGVLDLAPGHSCMVVPLYAGAHCFGVMTLDRERCEPYAPHVVGLVEVYGQVLALAITNAQGASKLARLHERDCERVRLLERELIGDAPLDYEGSSDTPMRRAVTQARQLALTDTPLLVLGEEGSGKGRFARAMHGWSRRAGEPFVAVDCTAADFERDLFGEGDAFGHVGLADGGTLYLASIEYLSKAAQAKLRDLDSVRVIGGSSLDLGALAWRIDRELYDRLSVLPLVVPALRDRLVDLPRLCAALLADIERRTGRRGLTITDEGLAKLASYDWPGNVRELANVMERAAIVGRDGILNTEDLDIPDAAGKALGKSGASGVDDADRTAVRTLSEVQRRHIAAVLEITGGRIYGQQGAAALLGVKPSTLQSKMKKLGLTRGGRS
jgi:transcriptional regulator with GAF, ATPase, and Fis domain